MSTTSTNGRPTTTSGHGVLALTMEFVATLSSIPAKAAEQLTRFLIDAKGSIFDRTILLAGEGKVLASAVRGAATPALNERAPVHSLIGSFAGAFGELKQPLWVKLDANGECGEVLRADPHGTFSVVRDLLTPDQVAAIQRYGKSQAAIGIFPIVSGEGDAAQVTALIVVEQFTEPNLDAVWAKAATYIIKQASPRINEALAVGASTAPALKPRKPSRQVLQAIGYVLGGLLLIGLVPCKDKVTGEGSLEPEERHRVNTRYSFSEMTIVEWRNPEVSHGTSVRQGQPLFRMRDDKLKQQILATRTEIERLQGEINEHRAVLRADSGDLLPSTKQNHTRGLMKASDVLDGKRRELGSLLELEKSLTVSAPGSGVVVDPKEFNDLIGKPYKADAAIATIGNPQGRWLVYVRVPEHELDRIAAALKKLENTDQKLAVTFTLATDPSRRVRGYVERIDFEVETWKNEPDQTPKKFVVVSFDKKVLGLENPSMATSKAGVSVTAHVECGWTVIGERFFVRSIWRRINEGLNNLW